MKPAINQLDAEAAASLAPDPTRAFDERPADSDDWQLGDASEADEAAWTAEMARRIAEIDDGTAVTFSAEEVMAEAKRRFG